MQIDHLDQKCKTKIPELSHHRSRQYLQYTIIRDGQFKLANLEDLDSKLSKSKLPNRADWGSI